ncbi:putative acetyltransferase [Geomicrobium halophilum]|uniref:Putative acetyltransferase n=1 Tax=Geomicrobium halophilum TaxID=549000 RepID=A0A841Q2Q4_9BACL|nr:hypothetical protein [Geomicrobium halophilum]MBB6451118.1 putative acetyltransferase [Geomicrobium halophilum]
MTMNTRYSLIKPSFEFQYSYLSMLNEWKSNEEKLVPFVLHLDTHPFEMMLKTLEDYEESKNLPQKLVAISTYWLIKDQHHLLGV